MAKKKKKPRTVRQVVEPKLREASRYWHEKKTARDAAKVKVEVGKFKNGNPKFKTMYKCAKCLNNFDRKDTQMDHIEPVIEAEVGFVDWNTYVERLFVKASGYQCLCRFCHQEKSKAENKKRRKKT